MYRKDVDMNKFRVAYVVGVFFLMFLLPLRAEAQQFRLTKEVFSPSVERSGLIFEGKAVVDFDSNERRSNRQNYKFSVGEGISHMWWTEAELEFQKAPQESDIDAMGLKWRNIVQVTEEEEFMDVAVLLSYEIAWEEGVDDTIEWGILAQKQLGPFLHTANLIFWKQVDWDKSTDGGFSWSTIYLNDHPVKPGFEYYIEELDRDFPDDQRHYIGPVVYGKKERIFYETGLLFGITDNAADAFLKVDVGYMF